MKVRVRFAKRGKIRFTSHRDVARAFERALRRAGLPVRYTEGFSPRPRLSFGLALPTGYESEAEYIDVDLLDGALGNLGDLPPMLDAALPDGLCVLAVAAVDRDSDPIQEAVTSCTWQVDLAVEPAEARQLVDELLAADHIIVERERKGRPVTDDVRPQIVALDVVGAVPIGARLLAELGTRPRTLRPSELLAAAAPSLPPARVCRLHQWIEQDGDRREPVEVPSAPRAMERAS